MDEEDIIKAKALYAILKDPRKLREALEEARLKRRIRRERRYG